ncbi:MAG: 50S ribosomal protein L17 [Flavobacteriales bacterium]|nr:50S ribosomal protein L17 [Flavobacteriales bacterium]|tara:strand:+ start:11079 stop:11810 length:732 start_codon:yes stop_codon:yes gene_type:complete
MRHGKKFNHLGRKTAHRKAMLSNMACSLIEHKRIKTTVAKAKALRKFVEPLITKSKTDTTHSRRIVFSHLRQKEVVTELFGDIASKVATRNGGYTRILRTGNRLGDNAEMCFIELVDYNETYVTDKPKKKAKSTRRSSGTKKASTTTPAAVEEAVVVEETISEETELKEAKTEEVVEDITEAPSAEVVEETISEESVVDETTEAPSAEVVVEEKAEATEETSEVNEEEIKEENNAEDNETKGE